MTRASESLPIPMDKEELDDQHFRFVLEYHSGENAGNATKSYMAIYPKANYNTAAVASHELLTKNPQVQKLLHRLHQAAHDRAQHELIPWIALAPAAQAVLLATVRGEMRNLAALSASREILDRAFGKPVFHSEVQVRDEARITRALLALQVRVQHERTEVGPVPDTAD